jgi:hypothetical protein
MRDFPSTQPEPLEAVADLLAMGYLRHLRARLQAGEKGCGRARKGLDDVGPRGKVSPRPEGLVDGGRDDET